MTEIYYGVDELMNTSYNKQEMYKKKENINKLYKTINSPLIWDYKLECFVTYLPFMLEYQKEFCNPHEIIS